MKRLLLPILLLLISGCKYGSMDEAYEACQKWRKEDVIASNGMTYKFLGIEYKRYCYRDYANNEILGIHQDITDTELIKKFAY